MPHTRISFLGHTLDCLPGVPGTEQQPRLCELFHPPAGNKPSVVSVTMQLKFQGLFTGHDSEPKAIRQEKLRRPLMAPQARIVEIQAGVVPFLQSKVSHCVEDHILPSPACSFELALLAATLATYSWPVIAALFQRQNLVFQQSVWSTTTRLITIWPLRKCLLAYHCPA